MALQGLMEQRDRSDVRTQFGNGSVSVLVATNVVGRRPRQYTYASTAQGERLERGPLPSDRST